MEYDIKLEKEIIKLKFKKLWFNDKSGYWFEKKIKYKDLDLKLIIESDTKLFLMSVKTGDYFEGKINFNKFYGDIKKFPLTLKKVKEVIKKYK